MATLKEQAAWWNVECARFLIIGCVHSQLRTKRFERAYRRYRCVALTRRGRGHDAAWSELLAAAIGVAKREQRAMMAGTFDWARALSLPTTTPEDTLREAGIGSRRQLESLDEKGACVMAPEAESWLRRQLENLAASCPVCGVEVGGSVWTCKRCDTTYHVECLLGDGHA
jgi:hypothetical protein